MTIFSLTLYVSIGVESKSVIHFNRPEPENLDNPE